MRWSLFIVLGLDQGLTNYNSCTKCGWSAVLENEAWLGYSYVHSFTCCLWQFSCYSGSVAIETVLLSKSKSIYSLAFCRKFCWLLAQIFKGFLCLGSPCFAETEYVKKLSQGKHGRREGWREGEKIGRMEQRGKPTTVHSALWPGL